VNWGETLIVGGVYIIAFAILTLIQSIVVYSIHQSSMAHLSIHLRLLPIFLATGIGEIFTLIISLSIPSITYWLPIGIGCALFLMVLIGGSNSNTREAISSGVIFCALTYFLFMLLTKIYTKEVLLGLFGLGG